MKLCVLETHPIQYHAPVWRALQHFSVDVTVIYGSDHSVRGYHDAEFGVDFAWDADLLDGYEPVFLAEGGRNRRDLPDTLERMRPDAALCVGYSGAFHVRALRAVSRAGLPLFFRAETSDEARDRSFAKGLARDVALRALYGRCESLLYIGVESRSHYERLGVAAEKLIFSPYCVDEDVFDSGELARDRERDRVRQRLGAHADDQVVLFSGKLSERKGPDLLLEAAARHPKMIVVFLGDGAMRHELEALAARLGVRAQFAGFVAQRALSPWFHGADVLCLPSRVGETWGLVVNEALLHGVPAVVSDGVGCRRDLVEEGRTGRLFTRSDAESLSHALVQARSLTGTEIRSVCRAKAALYSTRRAAEGIAAACSRVAKRCASFM
jgi:glycosyltransferase involved in cell wall biosynthesis